jgi:hypothetical protein
MNGTNPCAECQRNIAECPWLSSRGHERVAGWKANITTMLNNGRNILTYHIIKCPLYIPPKRSHAKNANQ